MASRYSLITLLPALVLAKIQVKISGKIDGDYSKMNVVAYGSEVGEIPDAERTMFNLGDENLKKAVESCFGRKPDHVFLRGPTHSVDLYQMYCWPPVLRTLKPKGSRILKVSSEPETLLEHIYENISYGRTSFNCVMSESVLNTVSSSWPKVNLSSGPQIEYEFDIKTAEGYSATTMSYTSSWGSGYKKEQASIVGWASGKEYWLLPRRRILAEVQAMRSTIEVEIEYEATLTGAVAVEYDDMYKDEHFWALDTGAVTSRWGVAGEVRSKEVIKLELFLDLGVVIYSLPNMTFDRIWYDESFYN